MINSKSFRRRLAVSAATLTICCAGSAASAQQILSAVQSQLNGNGAADTVVSGAAGTLAATTYGGADTYALTNFGVNKVYASGNADYQQYGTSAWVDSYTVGGTSGSMVNLTFTFSIDGIANFAPTSDAEFNFSVYALRGSGWSLTGYNSNTSGANAAFGGSDGYERVVLQQALQNGGVAQMDSRDFNGFYNYGPNAASPGQPGAFGSHVQLIGTGPTSYYSVQTVNGTNFVEQRLYASTFQVYTNGVLTGSGAYAINPTMTAIHNSLLANYSLLDMEVLCAGDACSTGNYPGSDLTVHFSLAAGSTFSLASIFTVDDLNDGTVDFFHTAKVTGVTVSDGATLTSQSGTLSVQSDGSYSYPAASAPAVPEPATWALLVGGFALAGGMMRRRMSPSAVIGNRAAEVA